MTTNEPSGPHEVAPRDGGVISIPIKALAPYALALGIGLLGGTGTFAIIRGPPEAIPESAIDDIRATKAASEKTREASEKTTAAVAVMGAQISTVLIRLDQATKQVDDHEQRLRALEAKARINP